MDEKDLSVAVDPITGAVSISTVIDNQRFHQTYFDYTEEEAIADFMENFQ